MGRARRLLVTRAPPRVAQGDQAACDSRPAVLEGHQRRARAQLRPPRYAAGTCYRRGMHDAPSHPSGRPPPWFRLLTDGLILDFEIPVIGLVRHLVAVKPVGRLLGGDWLQIGDDFELHPDRRQEFGPFRASAEVALVTHTMWFPGTERPRLDPEPALVLIEYRPFNESCEFAIIGMVCLDTAVISVAHGQPGAPHMSEERANAWCDGVITFVGSTLFTSFPDGRPVFMVHTGMDGDYEIWSIRDAGGVCAIVIVIDDLVPRLSLEPGTPG